MLHITLDVLIQDFAHAFAGIVVQRSNLLQARVTGENLVSDIQRQVSQLHAAFDHHFGSVRIGKQIEFRHWGNVATIEVSPPHDHHFLDALNDSRLLNQCQGQVGLRPQHGDSDAVGFG
ncbi:hypothetical protein D3C87_1320740 [compost metagenome]